MGDKISYTIHLTLGLEALLFKSFNLTSLTWTTHPQQESLILKNCECYSVLKKVSSTGVLRNNSFEKILRALVLESFGIITLLGPNFIDKDHHHDCFYRTPSIAMQLLK